MGTRLLALFPWNLHCFTARRCGYKEGPEPLAVSCDHLFPLLCYSVCSGGSELWPRCFCGRMSWESELRPMCTASVPILVTLPWPKSGHMWTGSQHPCGHGPWIPGTLIMPSIILWGPLLGDLKLVGARQGSWLSIPTLHSSPCSIFNNRPPYTPHPHPKALVSFCSVGQVVATCPGLLATSSAHAFPTPSSSSLCGQTGHIITAHSKVETRHKSPLRCKIQWKNAPSPRIGCSGIPATYKVQLSPHVTPALLMVCLLHRLPALST